jgi:hypothetical protein
MMSIKISCHGDKHINLRSWIDDHPSTWVYPTLDLWTHMEPQSLSSAPLGFPQMPRSEPAQTLSPSGAFLKWGYPKIIGFNIKMA